MKKTIISLFIIAMVWPLMNVNAQVIPVKSVRTATVKPNKLEDAPKKIFIKTFKIYYQMIAEAEKTVYGGRQFGGGSYTGDATARLAVGVEGVEPEDLQSLTNEIYQDYIGRLKDMGLQVMTAQDITPIDYFDGWGSIEGPHINQEQVKGSLMVVPDGFSYKVKKITKKGKERTGGFMAGIQSVNGADVAEFNSSAYGALPKISNQLDDAIVAEVAISVPSIYLDPKSKLGTAKIKGGPYLRLGKAKVSYVAGKLKKPGAPSPNSMVEMLLTKAVPINGVFEGEEFKAVATKSRTTVPSYATFFTVEDKTVALSNTISCDAEVYKREVKKPIDAFIQQSLDKLALGLKGEKVK